MSFVYNRKTIGIDFIMKKDKALVSFLSAIIWKTRKGNLYYMIVHQTTNLNICY